MRFPSAVFAVFLISLVFTGCGEIIVTNTVVETTDTDPVAAMEGGDPMPEVDADIQFPWMGKQSVMVVGDSFERQVAFVDFTADDAPEGGMLGNASVKADGSGSGEFTLPVKWIRSGDTGRDTKLMDGAWLDADTHANITFKATSLERVKPTVWKVTGTWTMRGVTKDIEFLANVRYLPEMKYVGKDIIRFRGKFDLNLKEYGMDNGSVGTPACAEVWTADIGILGVMVRK